MNIFFLDRNPQTCAQQHCDKHVVKMIVEYAQLLSTAHRVIDGIATRGVTKTGRSIIRWVLSDQREHELYIATHSNHPSAQWVRQSNEHYSWLFTLWIELMTEYSYRYGKDHKSGAMAGALSTHPNNIKLNGWVDPPPAMLDTYRIGNNSILSYRNYYNLDKRRFATWKKRQPPTWFTIERNNNDITNT